MTKKRLIDSFGRVHDNLRISVTDRCNIRCFYCMPAENVQFMKRAELLTFEEIVRFVQIMSAYGVRKVRITGGEPLVRKNVATLIEQLSSINGIDDIGLTTNGVLLASHAEELKAAGLNRINISLDALNAEKFKEITRRDGYEKVIEGIHAAIQVGFDPVKVNAVSVRGMTESEIVKFGEFALQTGVEIRFIEYMPLDADNAWEREKVLFAHEIREILEAKFGSLTPKSQRDKTAPATQYTFANGQGNIGFIASVSQPFCMSCNRFRLTADGHLRNCLFSLEETSIKDLLRGDASDDDIAQAVIESISQKKEGHEINTARFVQPDRAMYSIGG